jgi:hypothetical protein
MYQLAQFLEGESRLASREAALKLEDWPCREAEWQNVSARQSQNEVYILVFKIDRPSCIRRLCIVLALHSSNALHWTPTAYRHELLIQAPN